MVSADNRTGLYVAVPIYFAFLALVAFWGWRRTQTLRGQSDALSAHYLGARSFGPLITAGTMFASLFSGYTVVGVPNEAFKTGFVSLRWFPTLIGILGGYAGTGLRLRKTSLFRNHQSPADFITDRFRSQLLRYTVVMLQAIPSLIYLSAQVISIKGTFNSLFEIDPDSPVSVIIIFALILIFEWSGGLVSVASTDAIQGLVMSISFIALPVVIYRQFGGWQDLNPFEYPETSFYENPSAKTQWLIWNFGMVNIGFFTLPHLMQRTYAAKNITSLKWGYACLTIGGWFTWMPGILLGTMGVKILADAGIDNPSSPFAAILEQIMEQGGFAKVVGVIAFTASLAAIMSTADSLIIAISQLVTSEFIYPFMPEATPNKIAWIGRGISLCSTIIALLIGLFWDDGLSDLAKVQFGISLQCVPAFLVGLFAWGPTDCHPWSIAFGGIFGGILTIALYFGYIKDNDDAVAMDAGVTSAFFNIVLVFLSEVIRRIYTGTLVSSFRVGTLVKKTNPVLSQEFKNASVSFRSPGTIVERKEEETEDDVLFTKRPAWDKPKTSRFGVRPLTSKLLWKSMEGTWEPLTNPSLVFLLFFLITVAVPLVPENYPPTDIDGNFLFPPSEVNGIPWWALKMMMLSLVGTLVLLVMIFGLPSKFGLKNLDPDTIELLPKEMNKRTSYDHRNDPVEERRKSIVDSVELIRAKEQRMVDYEQRKRVSQLMQGVMIEEDVEESSSVEKK